MNSAPEIGQSRLRFSLSLLLTLTAFIAIGLSIANARYKSESLKLQHKQLHQLSARSRIGSTDQLAATPLEQVSGEFASWLVNVPEGQQFELLFGAGIFPADGLPTDVQRIHIPPGMQRVSLYKGQPAGNEYRYTVYLNGEIVFVHKMGRDWMPKGWDSTIVPPWPRHRKTSELYFNHLNSLQLTGGLYTPRLDLGPQNHFSGQYESSLSRDGFRLWIASADFTTFPPNVLFVQPSLNSTDGIGLADGIQIRDLRNQAYWEFFQPKLASRTTLVRFVAQFTSLTEDETNSERMSFPSWQLRNTATGTDPLHWAPGSSDAIRSVFLHAVPSKSDGPAPVVELQWDADKPDTLAVRLADTPQNDFIERWWLRVIASDPEHLWREIRLDQATALAPEDVLGSSNSDPGLALQWTDSIDGTTPIATGFSRGPFAISRPQPESLTDLSIDWQSTEMLPLQIIKNREPKYSQLKLYDGLAVRFGLQVPAVYQPKVSVMIADQATSSPVTGAVGWKMDDFPGGPVFREIQLELRPSKDAWILFNSNSKN